MTYKKRLTVSFKARWWKLPAHSSALDVITHQARLNEGVTQEMLTEHVDAQDGGFAVTQKILNNLLEAQPGMLGQILTNIETSKAEVDAKLAAEREPTTSHRM